MPAEADLDGIAWRVLSDLCRPGGELATLAPDGLERLITLRLEGEARRAGVPLEDLAEAFTRAMTELTGAGREPRPPQPEGPGETVDDL